MVTCNFSCFVEIKQYLVYYLPAAWMIPSHGYTQFQLFCSDQAVPCVLQLGYSLYICRRSQ